jgi:hypothetical protein
MEDGYICPLCPDHTDDVFIWNHIVHAPICQGCDYELWNDIYDHASRPESLLLDRLENLTKLRYEEYCLLEIESVLTDWQEHGPMKKEKTKHLTSEIRRLRAK